MAEFISKSRRMKLVIKPTYKEIVGAESVIHQGKKIQFENGYYKTEDKEEIAFLRKKIDGFHVIEITKGEKKAGAKPEPTAEEKLEFVCEIDGCGFVATSKEGLEKHQKKEHK